jgi:hypothetical protein
LSSIYKKTYVALQYIGYHVEAARFYDTTAQLPDAFIVYQVIHSESPSFADNRETSRSNTVQVSFYTRDGSLLENVPETIILAMKIAGFSNATGGGTNTPYFPDTNHYGWRGEFNFFERI